MILFGFGLALTLLFGCRAQDQPSTAMKSENDHVRAALSTHGDNGTKVREVNHYAYFKSAAPASEFTTWVRARGYDARPAAAKDGVVFTNHREVASVAFDDEVEVLKLEVTRLGGEYDGWECALAP